RPQQRAPVRASDVADIRDRRAAELERTRQSPAHLAPLEGARLAQLDDRPEAFGKNLKQRVSEHRIDARLAPFVNTVLVALKACFADV
ncbi:MAG TPA: hypothetical protein VEF55_08500, partial [Candidatus Binatia bacterium]|nr:hypothetical protein [Candidatus Binatia bacterium]